MLAWRNPFLDRHGRSEELRGATAGAVCRSIPLLCLALLPLAGCDSTVPSSPLPKTGSPAKAERGIRLGTTAAELSSLVGIVVDEQNQPVDGADVLPLLKNANFTQPRPAQSELSGAKTVSGSFQLDNLPKKGETLRVVHPDFAPAFFDVEALRANSPESAVRIILKRGATIRGHVYDSRGRPEPGVDLVVEDHHVPMKRIWDWSRLAVTTTDPDGAYEFQHLPDRACSVARVNRAEAPGVDRQMVLPESGQTITLDFGGTSAVTGELFVNGAPLANIRIVLADGGACHAVERTGNDGSFAFHGIPPGRRTLNYLLGDEPEDAVRIGTYTVLRDGPALGRIDLTVGKVTVQLVKPDSVWPEDVFVGLTSIKNAAAHGFRDTGRFVRPPDGVNPYILENVPAGRYRINVPYWRDRNYFEEVEVTSELLKPTVTVSLPTGSAKIRVLVDPVKTVLRALPRLQIERTDGRFRATLRAGKEEGLFECADLAAGEYRLSLWSRHEAPVLARFTLANDETKEIELTKDLLPATAAEVVTPAYLTVSVFTPEGVIIPGCDLLLSREGVLCPPENVSAAQTVFATSAGTYTLTVSFPGFETHQQVVELRQPTGDRRSASTSTVRVTLRPSMP